MRFNGAMTPYRIGWWTHSQYTRLWRRPHRPWQAESEFARFARRSLTARGALRKIARDDAAGRAGRLKTEGLSRYSYGLTSADSMAWSFDARRARPLPGCTHRSCANCLRYALWWRSRVVTRCTGNQQLGFDWEVPA